MSMVLRLMEIGSAAAGVKSVIADDRCPLIGWELIVRVAKWLQ